MKPIIRLSIYLLVSVSLYIDIPSARVEIQSPFSVRGALPWYNFLSGPSGWNYEDYTNYLDWMAEHNLNFVGFHCYTGGLERYVSYVEPLIRVEYRKVLPIAEFDTSLTARWGYSPKSTFRNPFLFGCDNLSALYQNFLTHSTDTPNGPRAWGGSTSTPELNLPYLEKGSHYVTAQRFMQRVFQYAHIKGIKVCLGFEFGIYPPEFFSIVPQDSMFQTPYLPDPTHPASIEILELYIQNIVQTYPDIDYIWFWLQEMNLPPGKIKYSESFKKFFDDNQHRFAYLEVENRRFYGVWALAYIQKAYEILHREAPKVQMAISGWGGNSQLPPLLPGLHQAVPKDVIFSCLNPEQGLEPQREIMGQLSGREVWIIPWLEGDARLWHPQPRVSLLAEQIAMAKNQGIQGIIGIHWRTKDIAANFAAFGKLVNSPPPVDGVRLMTIAEKTKFTGDFYTNWCENEYGTSNAKKLEPFWTRWDIEQILWPKQGGVDSPEYFPYDPDWGYLSPPIESEVKSFLETVLRLRKQERSAVNKSNLEYLENTLRFILLLHKTGTHLKPAYAIKNAILTGAIPKSEQTKKCQEALAEWNKAPLDELFTTYAKRVRSRGELGVLNSINQKLGVFAMELKEFLEERQK